MAEFTGRQKAAAVLVSMDPETAATVLKNLTEGELATVTKEMHALGELESNMAGTILHEFTIRASADAGISASPEVVRERLEKAMGHDAARQLLRDVGLDHSAEEVFKPLAEFSPEELHKLLTDEHPQTAAIVLSYLEPKQAASILSMFPPEAQSDVVHRMARTKSVDDTMVKRVAEIIRGKGISLGESHQTPEDPRFKKVAEVIGLLGPQVEERILKGLVQEAPDLAEKLREMMFVFEDLRQLSDGDMRKVLMSIDTQILAMSLKTASEELKGKIFANLSRRATETVTEEVELIGPKPRSQVKAAQQQIIKAVRDMEASGELNLRGAKYEEDPLV